MSNYQHTSFGRMLAWLSAETGASLTSERKRLVRDANRIRQWIYSRYQELKLAVDVEECVAVSQFSMDCNCQSSYTGISLPPEFINAASVWHNNQSVQMNSRWREYQDGMMRMCGNKLEATYVGVPAPTERDICPWGSCAFIGFQAMDPSDSGKEVIIQYRDINGGEHTDSIILKFGEYVSTSCEVRNISQPAGITLPEVLSGGILCAQLNSMRILSEFKPWEHKPAYRRLSLPAACDSTVLVRGTRRYHDLYWNHETAETHNELAVLAVYRFLKYSASGSATDGHQQLAKFHEAEAIRYLTGDQSREAGASTVNRFDHSHGMRRRGSLSTRG